MLFVLYTLDHFSTTNNKPSWGLALGDFVILLPVFTTREVLIYLYCLFGQKAARAIRVKTEFCPKKKWLDLGPP